MQLCISKNQVINKILKYENKSFKLFRKGNNNVSYN